MDQKTFAELEYDHKKRKTRREKFLERMEELIPWKRLEDRIRRHYPKAGRGRHPYPLRVMLRVHCVQLFYNLSDPAMEDLLYEVESVRRFVGLRLSDALPDETTILNFRRRLERHGLGELLLKEINRHLSKDGVTLKTGTIVDASIVAAPSSTKNAEAARDPEMHQAKKGNEWHFGMKVHIGVDDVTGCVHSVVGTAANVADITQVDQLLHGGELRVRGDAGYQGVHRREEHSGSCINWLIAMKPGARRRLPAGSKEALAERAMAQVRARVEHPFRYLKDVFGYRKVRYRGLGKNMNRVSLLLGFANLLIADSRSRRR